MITTLSPFIPPSPPFPSLVSLVPRSRRSTDCTMRCDLMRFDAAATHCPYAPPPPLASRSPPPPPLLLLFFPSSSRRIAPLPRSATLPSTPHAAPLRMRPRTRLASSHHIFRLHLPPSTFDFRPHIHLHLHLIAPILQHRPFDRPPRRERRPARTRLVRAVRHSSLARHSSCNLSSGAAHTHSGTRIPPSAHSSIGALR